MIIYVLENNKYHSKATDYFSYLALIKFINKFRSKYYINLYSIIYISINPVIAIKFF